jgi:hypothetical protein
VIRSGRACAAAAIAFSAACGHGAGTAGPGNGAPRDRDVASIYREAARAMGGEAAVAAVRALDTTASCLGPTGRRWTTHVVSARDGRFFFEQIHDDGSRPSGGFDGSAAWQCASPAGPCGDLDASSRSDMEGHELHMIALAPESRFDGPPTIGAGEFEGHPSRIVKLKDSLGAPVAIFYDAASGLPLGLHLVNHSGRGEASIVVVFERWERAGALRLFRRAVIRQGDAPYLFEFEPVLINGVPDSVFLPPESARPPDR